MFEFSRLVLPPPHRLKYCLMVVPQPGYGIQPPGLWLRLSALLCRLSAEQCFYLLYYLSLMMIVLISRMWASHSTRTTMTDPPSYPTIRPQPMWRYRGIFSLLRQPRGRTQPPLTVPNSPVERTAQRSQNSPVGSHRLPTEGTLSSTSQRVQNWLWNTPISPVPAPPNLSKLAGDVTVLLELFNSLAPTSPADRETQHQVIDTAIGNLLTIQCELQVRDGKRAVQPVQMVDTKVSSECVVCYDHIADVVLAPCMHLALCMTCCDAMGITERYAVWRTAAKCPICRTVVSDRMKVFRS